MKRKIVPYRERNENIYDHLDLLVKGGSSVFLDFFYTINRRLKRAIRIKAYQTAILPTLDAAYQELKDKKVENGKLGLEDLNRFKRLAFRRSFSETQYILEIQTFNDVKISYEAKHHLWEAIIDHLIEIGLSTDILGNALELAYQAPQEAKDFLAFNQDIDPYFIDEKGMFDGLDFNRFNEVMIKTSSVKELQYIGKRYELKVPTRLNRKQFQTALKERLEAQGNLNDELSLIIDQANLQKLDYLAKTSKINLSAYISKAQAVDLLLEQAQNKRVISIKTPFIDEANIKLLQEKITHFETVIKRLENHQPVAEEIQTPPRRSRFIRGILLGFLLAIIAFYLFDYFLYTP